ncbi:MAG: condensation domain-containing protein, partial [Cyanobacteria bacterium J06627_32]
MSTSATENAFSKGAMPDVSHETVTACSATFSQRRLWFLEQLNGSSALYNLRRTFKLTGSLNQAVLEEAINEIVSRHEALRTTFQQVEDEPVQVISEVGSLKLSVFDLRHHPAESRIVASAELCREAHNKPFNIKKGPLLRVGIVRLEENVHLLLVTMHHIISDGWSLGVFVKELTELYGAFSQGMPSPLPELEIQYGDFADWQREWLQGDSLEAEVSYWKDKLAGIPPAIHLPTDYARPAVQTFQGETFVLRLPQALTHSLKALCQETNTTPFMTLLSAFATLLHRYSGQNDIVVGSPIAGRSRSEVEKLIGFFVNTLVLRTSFAEGMSFRELLTQVRESMLEAYAHQDAPFEKLVEILQPERDPSRTPLFQVWFNFVNLGKRQLSLHDLQVETFAINNKPSARFDLTVYVREGKQGLSVQWVYNRSLFKESTIAFMSSSFETLLNSIVSAPEQPIETLSLLSAVQKQQLSAPSITSYSAIDGSIDSTTHSVELFPHTEVGQSIPARFAAQVEAYRSRVAIKTRRYEWTYGELDAAARRIAKAIVSHGQPTSQVGLLFEQDAPMVSALLGTLQAGKAYVALDANY